MTTYILHADKLSAAQAYSGALLDNLVPSDRRDQQSLSRDKARRETICEDDVPAAHHVTRIPGWSASPLTAPRTFKAPHASGAHKSRQGRAWRWLASARRADIGEFSFCRSFNFKVTGLPAPRARRSASIQALRGSLYRLASPSRAYRATHEA